MQTKSDGKLDLSFIWKARLSLWAEAILEVYGNIKLRWKNWNEQYHSCECHLENGEIFGFQK